MRVLWIALTGAVFAAASGTNVTFNKDVLPILQANCQGCHRPGEAAPMSFLSYKDTRPWAKAIRETVIARRMPPWFADPHVGKFKNDRSLSEDAIRTLTAWADTGAKEGDAKDAPRPVEFISGWNIGRPDLEIEMPLDYEAPATGTIEYTYFVVPTNFTEDRWVQMAEVRPGNRKVVHHVIAFVREPGSKWLRGAKPGEAFVPQRTAGRSGESIGGGEFLVGYAPGTVPPKFQPGQAKLVKAGSDIVLQMHYTATGKVERDRTKIGLIFAKEPPAERIYTVAASNSNFVIPPGAPAHRVDAELTLKSGVRIMEFLPHMHLRGKSFEYSIAYPDGRVEKVLNVPRYDFNWQLTYQPVDPIVLPAGAKVMAVAHFDNSANNPDNPDAKAEVRFGEQSWEEMMFGFMNVAFDAGKPVSELFGNRKRASD